MHFNVHDVLYSLNFHQQVFLKMAAVTSETYWWEFSE